MAIVNFRVIRKTVEATDSERIFDETLWRKVSLFGIPIMYKKVSYHCSTPTQGKKSIGFKKTEK